MKYSLILPAYNEEKHIRKNLQLLSSIRRITEIIVVDDASKDKTAKVVESLRNRKIKLHKLPRNIGKTAAVLYGVRQAKYKNLIFYDADLLNMEPEYVEDMLDRYEFGIPLVIMSKNSAPWVFREFVRSVPANSGTRVLSKKEFQKIKIDPHKPWALEAVINDYYLSKNAQIGFAEAPGVYDPRKYQKYNFFHGLWRDITSAIDVIVPFGIKGIPRNMEILQTIYDMYHSQREYEAQLIKNSSRAH